MSLFLEMHVLQSIPVANLNRDDLGSPKTVEYGGVDRIRVSSQAWKRPIRHGVEADLGERAVRTRQLPNRLGAHLDGAGWSAAAASAAWDQIAAAVGKEGKKLKSETSKQTGLPITSVLLLMPEIALDELAALCEQHRVGIEAEASKKKPQQIIPVDDILAVLKRRNMSINLFGRMLAELPGANVDGAIQIAHAFTTHAAEPQRDYFTAVDDWMVDTDETGSALLSTAEFSAGVFYRYGCLNLTDLLDNLRTDPDTQPDTEVTQQAVSMFADQFVWSLPQAKKNSTAPHTIPDLAYLTVRSRRPVSFAAAFETPVRPGRGGGIAAASRDAFDTYAGQVHRLTSGRDLLFNGYAGVDGVHQSLGDRFDSYPAVTAGAVEALFAAQRERA